MFPCMSIGLIFFLPMFLIHTVGHSLHFQLFFSFFPPLNGAQEFSMSPNYNPLTQSAKPYAALAVSLTLWTDREYSQSQRRSHYFIMLDS